jgi:hypothetical protein
MQAFPQPFLIAILSSPSSLLHPYHSHLSCPCYSHHVPSSTLDYCHWLLPPTLQAVAHSGRCSCQGVVGGDGAVMSGCIGSHHPIVVICSHCLVGGLALFIHGPLVSPCYPASSCLQQWLQVLSRVVAVIGHCSLVVFIGWWLGLGLAVVSCWNWP